VLNIKPQLKQQNLGDGLCVPQNKKTNFPPLKTKHCNMIDTNLVEETASAESNLDVKVRSFITQDPDLLKQYYDMRHEAYRDENGWKEYDGSESELDRKGHIIVALKGDKVVGGCRVMFSDECDYLSNEIPDSQYLYMPFIQKYDKREGIILSEISSVVVLKGHRDRKVSHSLFHAGIEESAKKNVSYICGVGVATVCRDYRRIFKDLGFYLEIVIKFIWDQKKKYSFTKMFFMYVKIK